MIRMITLTEFEQAQLALAVPLQIFSSSNSFLNEKRKRIVCSILDFRKGKI